MQQFSEINVRGAESINDAAKHNADNIISIIEQVGSVNHADLDSLWWKSEEIMIEMGVQTAAIDSALVVQTVALEAGLTALGVDFDAALTIAAAAITAGVAAGATATVAELERQTHQLQESLTTVNTSIQGVKGDIKYQTTQMVAGFSDLDNRMTSVIRYLEAISQYSGDIMVLIEKSNTTSEATNALLLRVLECLGCA